MADPGRVDASNSPLRNRTRRGRSCLGITESEWDEVGRRLGVPPRQVEVIRAFVAGYQKPEAIGQLLGIKPSSVKTHIERLYRNLGVHDRVEIVVCVCEQVLAMRTDSLR